MPEIVFVGAFIMVVAIVAINNVGGVLKKKFESGDNVSQDALMQIQADLNALKKSVDEMKEYLTDLYIQQHDEELK